MTAIDVKELTREELPAGRFPADSRADFRLYMAPQVRRGIEQHAKADPSVEICGVLVGRWGADENGPFAVVSDYIRCEKASSKFAEVTFTHESWAQINKEMDSRFADERIVGWYHSHPDFGIFLSERDCFIHEHFFSAPGQVAYVFDPVRDEEGVFAWRNGKPTPLRHFWVGDEIRAAHAGQRSPAPQSGNNSPPAGAHSPHIDRPAPPRSSIGFATAALGVLAVFVLGYLAGGFRSAWEQRMIIEGAVAHFAGTKLIREGLEAELAAVRARLNVINRELANLPPPAAELSPEEAEAAAKRRQLIRDNLLYCEKHLARIEEHYGLSDVERTMLARIAALLQDELRRPTQQPTRAAPKPADSAAKAAPPEKADAPPAPPNEIPPPDRPME